MIKCGVNEKLHTLRTRSTLHNYMGLKAQALRPGDTIGIIAPSSAPAAEERITRSAAYFEALGYRVEIGKYVMKPRGYLAATDKERLMDFHSMVKNKRIKAIFFIRGGYGTIRILPSIDYDLIKSNPKIIVGYSDATSFISAIYKKTGLQSMFFGPMPGVDIWNGFDPFAEEHFWKVLTSNKPAGELPMSPEEGVILSKGKENKAKGRLIGGNLTVFSSTFGTPYLESLKNKILFFEDIDERPYRIDRYLGQIKASGQLDQVAGVMLGQFGGCVPEEGKPSLTLDEVFTDYFAKLGVPVVANLPSGHVTRQWTIPYGAKYTIDASKTRARISVDEAVLQ